MRAVVLQRIPSAPSRAFSHESVEFFADVVRVFGVPPSVGQIYGLLYASPVPLSFTDIVEQLDISKGSASQGLQLLRSLDAVIAVTHEDDRREYFEPELSLRKLMSGVLQEQVSSVAATGTSRVTRLRALAEQEKDAKAFCLDRVRQLETWQRRLKTVLPVLIALLGPKRRSR